MVASTPRILPILSAEVASARSLFEKFCSAMILLSILCSMTEYVVIAPLVHQQIRNALTDILIPTEDRHDAALHSGIAEVHYCRPLRCAGECAAINNMHVPIVYAHFTQPVRSQLLYKSMRRIQAFIGLI